MVGVGVGVEDGVDAMEMGAEGLFAEVGAGVDEDGACGLSLSPLDEDGGTEAFVVWVRGGADGAVAAQGGHSHGGARSQECEGSLSCGGECLFFLVHIPSGAKARLLLRGYGAAEAAPFQNKMFTIAPEAAPFQNKMFTIAPEAAPFQGKKPASA